MSALLPRGSYEGVAAPALATAFDLARARPNAPAFDTCAACGRSRPVYPEPDATEVCLDCYEARNGAVL